MTNKDLETYTEQLKITAKEAKEVKLADSTENIVKHLHMGEKYLVACLEEMTETQKQLSKLGTSFTEIDLLVIQLKQVHYILSEIKKENPL